MVTRPSHYMYCFQLIGTQGRIRWNNNFMTFIDTMVQISTLRLDCREVMLPTFVRKIVIDVTKHCKILKTLSNENPGKYIFSSVKNPCTSI